jgi:hypothetical protein
MKNKKINFLIIGIILTLYILPSDVNAHVLKTSGSVGAVVHVTPEDDPIAGEQTDFFFDFKDRDGKFKAENCDCKVTILKAGQEAYTAPLFQNNSDPSLTNVSFSYTFPEKNIYQVKISGKPLIPDAFQEFNLEYDIRVARITESLAEGTSENNSESKKNNLLPYILPIGIIVILGLLAFIKFKKKN